MSTHEHGRPDLDSRTAEDLAAVEAVAEVAATYAASFVGHRLTRAQEQMARRAEAQARVLVRQDAKRGRP